MKAKYVFLGLVLVGSVFCSCSRDEESFFDKSAAERAQEAMDNANNVFVSPVRGWEMLYFANPESRGYNLIVKFREDGQVIATAKNSLTTGNKMLTDSTSTWEVVSDYGPLLTFNTFNEVLHAWADPQEDGDGYLGDYEFLILLATPERVVLKGKKHSAYMIMRPMPDMDQEEYFDACASRLTKYFGNGNIMTLKQGNELYYLHNGSTGLFNIVRYGDKAQAEDPVIYPICPTLDGFVMSFGFLDNHNERLYTLMEDNTFVGEEGSIISAGDLSQLFITYIDVNKGWKVDLSASTGELADAITSFQNQMIALTKDSKAKLNSIAITYSDTVFRYQGAFILRLKYEYKNGSKKTSSVADFAISVKNADGKLILTYDRPANEIASVWYQQASEMPKLVQSVMGTFGLKAEDTLNPTTGLNLINDKSNIAVVGASGLK